MRAADVSSSAPPTLHAAVNILRTRFAPTATSGEPLSSDTDLSSANDTMSIWPSTDPSFVTWNRTATRGPITTWHVGDDLNDSDARVDSPLHGFAPRSGKRTNTQSPPRPAKKGKDASSCSVIPSQQTARCIGELHNNYALYDVTFIDNLYIPCARRQLWQPVRRQQADRASPRLRSAPPKPEPTAKRQRKCEHDRHTGAGAASHLS